MKKTIEAIIGVGVAGAFGYLAKKGFDNQCMIADSFSQDFHGVPVSDLTALAKELHSDQFCRINEDGKLDFYYKSNRGHTPLCSHNLYVKGGKLCYDGDDSSGAWGSGKTSSFISHANDRFFFED